MQFTDSLCTIGVAEAPAYLGPVGIRLEIGDEIYFMDGARNNIRGTFGPTIRF